jgi:GWxTD domain-containing protein
MSRRPLLGPWHRTAAAGLLLTGLLALAGAGAPAAGAEPPARDTHLGRPRFRAEVGVAMEADSSYALLRVEVPYRELSFRRVPGGLEARFDVIVHIYERDRQILGDLWPQHIQVPDREALSGPEATFVTDIPFVLNPGRYRFEVRLSEVDAGIEGVLQLGLTVPIHLPGQLYLSSILVGDCGLTGSIAALRRNPAIRREFFEARDTLCAYAEVHHRAPEGGDSLQVDWQIHDSAGDQVSGGRLSRPVTGATTRLSWGLPVADLWLDAYELRVTVHRDDQQASGTATLRFMAESDPALTGFFRESLGVLEYIADPDEMRALRMAPARDRKRLWEAFWKRRDPTPETAANEFKEEFFRRVRYANEAFSVLRPGWRSDRGRIYITYGHPDQITRDPYVSQGPPTEIWYYDRLGLRFVFVDRTGYGNYQLVQPGW